MAQLLFNPIVRNRHSNYRQINETSASREDTSTLIKVKKSKQKYSYMLSTILFTKKLHNGNIFNKSIKKIKIRKPAYYGCSLNTTTYKSSKSYPFLSFTNKVVCT